MESLFNNVEMKTDYVFYPLFLIFLCTQLGTLELAIAQAYGYFSALITAV